MILEQLELIPETEEEKVERFTKALNEHHMITDYAKRNKDLMDAHLKSAISDMEKGIVRLKKKLTGLQAYLQTRKMLKNNEELIKALLEKTS